MPQYYCHACQTHFDSEVDLPAENSQTDAQFEAPNCPICHSEFTEYIEDVSTDFNTQQRHMAGDVEAMTDLLLLTMNRLLPGMTIQRPTATGFRPLVTTATFRTVGLNGGVNGLDELLMQMMSGHPLTQQMIGNPGDYALSNTAFENILNTLLNQTQHSSHPPPLQPQQIAALPRVNLQSIESADTWECAVCKDEDGDQGVQLPCKHIFHEGCIETWLKVNGSCPVCRSVIPSESEEQPSQQQS